ncbi:MAG: glycosyltransferase family 9 protein [Bacteroidetes bacterium]|nr:glycosyltransferase family 9 protein [Bacteroidota bacterium]
MKILVIRFSSIGDIVLTTPVMRVLKKQLKDAEVHFLIKKQFASIVESNPYVDKVHTFDGNLPQLVNELKQEQFDYIIDLHKNFRSYRIRWALGVKTLSYRKLSVEKFLLTKFGIDRMPGRHITQRCLDAVLPLGVKDDGEGLDYFIPEKDQVSARQLPQAHHTGFVAIVIGASYYTKKLPVHQLQALCREIKEPIILVGGKEDAGEGEQIASIDSQRIFNACGKFNLHASADLLRQSRIVISHDTGMQYIACALQKKVLAIWGGTSPKLDVEPYYGTRQNEVLHQNFVVPNLSCQPCSNFGTKTCPKGHFKCMVQQDVKKIAEGVGY